MFEKRTCSAEYENTESGANKHVVAAVLMYRETVCLLRRSSLVSSDRGHWMCVTGYLPPRKDPLQQARTEIGEETGVTGSELTLIRQAEPIQVAAEQGLPWVVSPFLFTVQAPTITLNWENDDVLWLRPDAPLPAMTTFWLPAVLSSLLVGFRPANSMVQWRHRTKPFTDVKSPR